MLDLNQEYQFMLGESYCNGYLFTSKPKEAFELARNYEADLLLNNKLIYCPLGMEYEENKELLLRYLGLTYKDIGYKDKSDKCFANVIKEVVKYNSETNEYEHRYVEVSNFYE